MQIPLDDPTGFSSSGPASAAHMTGRPVIAIVGAGQIGSRHLQALAGLDRPALLHIVDPSDASRASAESRWLDVAPIGAATPGSHRAVTDLPSVLDVAILATGANVRLEALRELLSHATVKYLILEKVLFQSAADFIEAEKLLWASGARVWVNCPRRLSTLYTDLRAALDSPQDAAIHVTGSNWGLGCNAVHFLDLIAYITSAEAELRFREPSLDPPFAAKRPGFIEFTGTMEGCFGPGVRFSLTSWAGGSSPLAIHVESPDLRCFVVEGVGRLDGWMARAADNWEWKPLTRDFPFQSQLTQIVVNSILETGDCGLSSFAESARLHLPLLQTLNTFYLGPEAGPETRCPIT